MIKYSFLSTLQWFLRPPISNIRSSLPRKEITDDIQKYVTNTTHPFVSSLEISSNVLFSDLWINNNNRRLDRALLSFQVFPLHIFSPITTLLNHNDTYLSAVNLIYFPLWSTKKYVWHLFLEWLWYGNCMVITAFWWFQTVCESPHAYLVYVNKLK